MFSLDNEQNESLEPVQTLDELLAEYETYEHSALNANTNTDTNTDTDTHQNDMSVALHFLNTDTNILSNPFDPEDYTFHTFNMYKDIVDHEPITENSELPTIKFMIHHNTQPLTQQPRPTLWMRVHTLYDSDMDPFISDPYMEEEFPLHILQLFVEYAKDGKFCFLENTDETSIGWINEFDKQTRSYWIKLPDNSLTPHIYEAIKYYSSRALNNHSSETYPHYITHHINHKMKQIPTLYQHIKEMWFYQYQYPYPE